jgi:O-antigen/teichoic acid export membrane protein
MASSLRLWLASISSSKVNYFLGIFEQIIVSGGNFCFVILLSKLLLPDDFGTYSLIWIIFISIGSLFSAWFSSPLISIQPTLSSLESTQFLNDLTKQILMLLSFLIVILFIFFLIFDDIFKIEIFILSAALTPYLLYEFLRRLAMIKNRLRYLLPISFSLYCSLFFGSIFIFDGNFLSITLIIIISYGVCALLLLVLLRQNFLSGNLGNLNQRRIEFSKWMSYSSLLQFISSNAVSILSATLLPLSEIGVLRLAQTFVGLFNPILTYLDNHVRIYFSRILSTKGKAGLEIAFQSFKIKFLLTSLLGITILGCFGIFLIDLFYPEFSDTYLQEYFALYLILLMVTMTSFIYRLRLIVLENTNLIFRTYLLGSIMTMMLFYPLVINFGGFGVILTLLSTHLVIVLALMYPSFLVTKLGQN